MKTGLASKAPKAPKIWSRWAEIGNRGKGNVG